MAPDLEAKAGLERPENRRPMEDKSPEPDGEDCTCPAVRWACAVGWESGTVFALEAEGMEVREAGLRGAKAVLEMGAKGGDGRTGTGADGEEDTFADEGWAGAAGSTGVGLKEEDGGGICCVGANDFAEATGWNFAPDCFAYATG